MRTPIALVLTGVCLGGCASGPDRPALINHVVLFKLNDPAEREALASDCDAMVEQIPGIASYFCGEHHDVGRDTVDGDYDIGFYVGFMSDDDYAAYVEHPEHVALVARWGPRLEWIRVHDVLDETP